MELSSAKLRGDLGGFARNNHREKVIFGNILNLYSSNQLAVLHDCSAITKLADLVDVMINQKDAKPLPL